MGGNSTLAKSLNLADVIESLSKLNGNFNLSIVSSGRFNVSLSKLGGKLQLLMSDGSHNVTEVIWVKASKFWKLPPFMEYNERSSLGIVAEPKTPRLVTLGPSMEKISSSFLTPLPKHENVSKFSFQSTLSSVVQSAGSCVSSRAKTLRAFSFGWLCLNLMQHLDATNSFKLVGNELKVTPLRYIFLKLGWLWSTIISHLSP